MSTRQKKHGAVSNMRYAHVAIGSKIRLTFSGEIRIVEAIENHLAVVRSKPIPGYPNGIVARLYPFEYTPVK